MKIAYQGIKGSFSHRTLAHFSGEKVGLPTFREVYEAVEKGEVDLGLLPIENTLAGTIYETIDLLSQGDLKIVGELHTQVEHSLLALPGAKISKVLSHPKALAQCKKLFEAHPEWEAVPHYDTAGAAADIARTGDRTLAALANRSAAEIYGLEVVSIGVQDHDENYTRFFLIAKTGHFHNFHTAAPSPECPGIAICDKTLASARVEEQTAIDGRSREGAACGNYESGPKTGTTGKKGSLCFRIDHRPGKLAEMLHFFAREGMNLTYIVSRPIVGKPFEYLFYVDLELAGKLPEIEGKILGTYETIRHWRD